MRHAGTGGRTTSPSRETRASATCCATTGASSLARRIKAICWWCHQHGEHPEPAGRLAANALTDRQIERLYRQAWEHSPQGAYETFGIPNRYGTGIDWNEFHTSTRYPNATE